jgi:hypothetical protein
VPKTPQRPARRAQRLTLIATCLGAAAIAAPASAAVTLPDGILGANYSFEAGTTGWSGYQASIARSAAADAPDGGSVLKVTRTTGTYFTADDLPDTVTSSVAGRTYVGTAHVKAASTSSVSNPIAIRIREKTRTGALVREWTSAATTLSTAYKRITVTAMATATGNVMDVRVSHTSAASGDAFFVDALTLSDGVVTTPPPPVDPPPPSPVDTTAPVVSLSTAPAGGASVSGAVPLVAAATDDTGVDRVEWYIDGTLGWTERYSPYKFGAAGTWDSTAVANGTHVILAKAFDAAGNVSSVSRSVTVANPVTPPPSGGDPHAYPFDPGFAFNQPIPAGVSTDARSAGIVSQIAENVRISKPFLGSQGEVPTVYVAKSTDPLYTTTVGGKTVRFRVPANAQAGSGADSPMVIQDPNHPDYGPSTELRLWQARINTSARTLSASGAGLFHYNNDGLLYNGARSLGQPFLGQGTGSGLTITAGLIRPEEFQAGEIRHALRFTYSNRDFTNRWRAPATRTDQPNGTTTRNAGTAMDMGMRLQLDPSVDCDARTVPGQAATSGGTKMLRMICRAMQKYGMIAMDGSSDRVMLLQMENSTTANWPALIGSEVYGSYGYLVRDNTSPSDGYSRNATSGIPWSKLRVLSTSVFPSS